MIGLYQILENSISALSKVISSILAVATPLHVFGVSFLPESSYLIGQFAGSVHYFYVTDDGRSSVLQKWFSDKKNILVGKLLLRAIH